MGHRKRKSSEGKKLGGLREEFDALCARMQTRASRKGVDRLLSASAEDLNATARKRGGKYVRAGADSP